MKRKLTRSGILALALLSVVLLGACGGSTTTPPAPAGASEGLPTFRYFYTDN